MLWLIFWSEEITSFLIHTRIARITKTAISAIMWKIHKLNPPFYFLKRVDKIYPYTFLAIQAVFRTYGFLIKIV